MAHSCSPASMLRWLTCRSFSSLPIQVSIRSVSLAVPFQLPESRPCLAETNVILRHQDYFRIQLLPSLTYNLSTALPQYPLYNRLAHESRAVC